MEHDNPLSVNFSLVQEFRSNFYIWQATAKVADKMTIWPCCWSLLEEELVPINFFIVAALKLYPDIVLICLYLQRVHNACCRTLFFSKFER